MQTEVEQRAVKVLEQVFMLNIQCIRVFHLILACMCHLQGYSQCSNMFAITWFSRGST